MLCKALAVLATLTLVGCATSESAETLRERAIAANYYGQWMPSSSLSAASVAALKAGKHTSAAAAVTASAPKNVASTPVAKP